MILSLLFIEQGEGCCEERKETQTPMGCGGKLGFLQQRDCGVQDSEWRFLFLLGCLSSPVPSLSLCSLQVL